MQDRGPSQFEPQPARRSGLRSRMEDGATDESAAAIIDALRRRLVELRQLGDKRSDEIVGQCEEVITEIEAQLDAIASRDGSPKEPPRS